MYEHVLLNMLPNVRKYMVFPRGARDSSIMCYIPVTSD